LENPWAALEARAKAASRNVEEIDVCLDEGDDALKTDGDEAGNGGTSNGIADDAEGTVGEMLAGANAGEIEIDMDDANNDSGDEEVGDAEHALAASSSAASDRPEAAVTN
jgi:hypothetical protein